MITHLSITVIATVMSNFVHATETYAVPACAWVVGPQKDVWEKHNVW